jgi:hypothetical protein
MASVELEAWAKHAHEWGRHHLQVLGAHFEHTLRPLATFLRVFLEITRKLWRYELEGSRREDELKDHPAETAVLHVVHANPMCGFLSAHLPHLSVQLRNPIHFPLSSLFEQVL